MRRSGAFAVMLATAAAVGLAVPAQAAVLPSAARHETAKTHAYTWTRLVDLPVASKKGSSDSGASVHAQSNIVVAKVNRKKVLAGDVPAGGTGVATFNLGKHCTKFTTTVGVADSSPHKGYITFSVYFGDVAEIVKEPKHGKTSTISLNVSGVSKLVLRNTEPDPAGSLSGDVIATWPSAQVYCNTTF